MTIKLIDIAVTGHERHPYLSDRINGTVRAVLSETHAGYSQEHVLRLRVWAAFRPGMTTEDIETALLIKAGDLVARVKARLEPPQAAE